MPIIFITGCDDVPTTIQGMKSGAAELLTKPFSGEVLLSAIQQALERSRSRDQGVIDPGREMTSTQK